MVPRYKIWFFAMNELCWFQRNYTLRDQLTGRCPGKIHLFWVDVSPLKELVGFPASYVSLPGGTFNNKKEFLWPWVAIFFEKKSRTSSRYPEVFFSMEIHGVRKFQTTQVVSMWIYASRSDHQEAANCYFSPVSDAVRRIMKFSFRRNVGHHPMYTSNQAKMHW